MTIPSGEARPDAEAVAGSGVVNQSAIRESSEIESGSTNTDILILTGSVLMTVPKKGNLVIPDPYSNITDSTTKNRLVTGMMAVTEGGSIYKGIVYRNMTTDLPGVDYPAFCTDKGGARPEFSSNTWTWINDYCNYGGYSPGNSYQINHTYYPPWETCVPDGGAVKLYLYCNASGGQLYGAYNMTTLPPVADFSANATSGSAPLAIQFYDASQNFPSARVWSFGDGGTSTETHPVHVFTSPGTYTISLTAANAGGNDTEVKTGYVTVSGGGSPPGEYILVANFSQANNWGGAAVSNHHIAGVAWNNWTNVTKLVVDGHFYDYGIGSDTCSGTLKSNLNSKNIGTFTHTYSTLRRNSYNAEAHLEYTFGWTSNPDPGTSYIAMVGDDCSDIISFSGGVMTKYPPYGPNRANVGSIGSLSNASIKVYGPPPVVPPLANFTASPTSGPAPLMVSFTDTSTGTPTAWTWNFGDGAFSAAQNPSHEYAAAGTYAVSLNVSNAGGWNRTVREGYLTVTSPVACDATGPYVDFVIENVSYSECDSGVWQRAVCRDNAVIRWALAGKSSPFYATLLPWMWKRNLNCPNPGYSFAVDQPYNKPIYLVGVKNLEQNPSWLHAVDAELMTSVDPEDSTWEDWKFFQYDNLDIQIGDYQIPVTPSLNTEVWITNVTSVDGCGQYHGPVLKTFYIAPNKSVYLTPVKSSTIKSNFVSETGKTSIKKQIVPDELKDTVRVINRNRQFTINKWEFDPTTRELTFYIFDISNQHTIDDLQGPTVSNYSIRMVHDTEFEKNRADVEQQLVQLKKDSKYQIAGISMITDRVNDPPGNYAELWVYQSTRENQMLEKTVIQDWTIQVYPVSTSSPA